MMRRTDRFTAKLDDVDLFFCGDEVYWYFEGPNLEETPLDRLPLDGALADPNVAIVTALPAGANLSRRESISPELLERFAAAAVVVIVGAWDWEGLVFWEPTNAGGCDPEGPLSG